MYIIDGIAYADEPKKQGGEASTMKDRDLAMHLISSIPDAQLRYVVGLLQNFKAAIDEAGRGTLQFQEEEP